MTDYNFPRHWDTIRMTDYNFPRHWDKMTADEKNRWYHAERARRQALWQHTRTSKLMYEGDAKA